MMFLSPVIVISHVVLLCCSLSRFREMASAEILNRRMERDMYSVKSFLRTESCRVDLQR